MLELYKKKNLPQRDHCAIFRSKQLTTATLFNNLTMFIILRNFKVTVIFLQFYKYLPAPKHRPRDLKYCE